LWSEDQERDRKVEAIAGRAGIGAMAVTVRVRKPQAGDERWRR
jgi:hypothetical protein